MASVKTAEIRRRRAELIERVQHTQNAAGVFTEASTRLQRLVPHDAAGWVATDPGTGLPIAPTRLENIGEQRPDECREFWQREYLEEDVNRFSDLARSDLPAATLLEAGDPNSSPRYRDFLRPQGIEDELRVVMRSADEPWAVLSMWRRTGSPPFTTEDARLMASLSEPLGATLRSRARHTTRADTGPVPERPGLLLFDTEGSLISVNEAARTWLVELPEDPGLPTDFGVEVPYWMTATVFRTRALAEGGEVGSARARVRTRRGTWMVCHGSCLLDPDGTIAETALVLEPAKGADVAPIIVQAYDLSEREQQITRLIARGSATSEIADELYISQHTVRDHIKAIFQKVEVSSRGELVATLFADHYWPAHERDVLRVYESED